MSDTVYLLLIAGMGLVTFIPRWLPLFVLAGKRLPRWLVEWLDLIPVAILASLLAPLVLTPESPGRIDLIRPELLAAIPALIFAVRVKSLGGTVIVGMLAFWLISMAFNP